MNDLLSYPNVVGYGQGQRWKQGVNTMEPCVTVMVRDKVDEIELAREEIIPDKYGGEITDVMQVGNIRALKERTDEWRPAPGGVSIGHYAITAGTFGCVVRRGDTRYILSNNHVLANSNNAIVGDAIMQPGPYDGGGGQIATLTKWVPIEFGGGGLPTCPFAEFVAGMANWFARLANSNHRLRAYQVQQVANVVDAAIAQPLHDNMISDKILDIGYVSDTVLPYLGMRVVKSGRTTKLTSGTVSVLDATIVVSYGNQSATFEHQIITTGMSEGGDSGSLLVAEGNEAVGLLFAGSSEVTIHCPIEDVLFLLGVTL